jgi:hypothetical protein
MPSKREIIELFKREELQQFTDQLALEVRDRRVKDDLVDALVRSKRARVQDMLGALSRDRLKDICLGLDLDSSGREKSLIIDRILGEPATNEGPNDDLGDAPTLLARLLGEQLDVSNLGAGWPTQGKLRVGDSAFEVDIYVRTVGGSARGNALERRFQNPSQQSPIIDVPDRYEMLLGIWTERGEGQSVIVAFDAYRRLERTTRFSLFMPLALLEQAADTGFATHENAKGETIYAFRPENIGRYVQAMFDSDQWSPQVAAGGTSPATPTRPRPVVDAVAPPSPEDALYIRPRVGMYAAFARLNYKPWFALAEFVDNSIQSYLSQRERLALAGHDEPLIIDINLDDSEISIIDRAAGIAWEDFPRAFSPAAPPVDASGLSEFGLGMKAAACWFAKRWSVRTSALGEPVERTVSFDIPRIARDGLESLPIETRSARESDHYTVITLQELRVHPRGRTLAKIKSHLASIYRVLMAEDLVRIRVTASGTTEELRFEPPELLCAPHYRERQGQPVLWRKEFAVEFNEKRVKGWAGIMRSGSHSTAGFSVFRRRRLIEGSVGETYKPAAIFGSPNSFASQRVVGELYVEGFDVTHTKDGIQWHNAEDEVLDLIRAQLDAPPMPLLDQADGYRARTTASDLPKNFGADALDETARAFTQPETLEVLRNELSIDGTEVTFGDGTAPTPELVRQREFRIPVEGSEHPWTVVLELISDRASPFYTTSMSRRDDDVVLVVQVNLDHDFSIAYLNNNEAALPPVLRLLAALAVSEKVARDGGVRNAGAIRISANTILRALACEHGSPR